MFTRTVIKQMTAGTGADLLLQADGSKPCQELAERAGTVQVVCIDPPFMTGDVFERRRRFGSHGWRTGSPNPTYRGYEDPDASPEAYRSMLRGLIENAWMLLRPDGMLCLHLDWRASHTARVLCDEIFGADRFVNEIIWSYESGGRSTRRFSSKHDTILMYARTRNYRFDITRVPMVRGEVRKNHMRRNVDEEGRAYRSIRSGGKEYRYYDDDPVYPGDVWTDISHLQQRDPERAGYPTQKPLRLLDRLLRPLVQPGDTVADLCCGSGTTLVAAQALGCRVIGLDIEGAALAVTASRLNMANVTLQADFTADDTGLTAAYDPEAAMVTLTGFTAQHPAFPREQKPLDTLEQWYAGSLEGDTFTMVSAHRRTVKHYELDPSGVAGSAMTKPAVVTVDAAGVFRAYRWVDE